MAFSNDGKDEGRPLRNDCIPLSASRAVPGEREGGEGGGRGEGGRGGERKTVQGVSCYSNNRDITYPLQYQ